MTHRLYNYPFTRTVFSIGLLLALVVSGSTAFGQQPYIGEIRMFAGNFAPQGWALCDGQLIQISQNTALFSILGTTYGGDGRTTFALPDLRGRVPVHMGQGAGLTTRNLGEMGGEEAHSLLVSEMPAHTHTIAADSSVGLLTAPGGAFPARSAAGIPQYGVAGNSALNPGIIGSSGGGNAHNTMPPYTVVNFIIALQGIFPPRN